MVIVQKNSILCRDNQNRSYMTPGHKKDLEYNNFLDMERFTFPHKNIYMNHYLKHKNEVLRI